MTKFTFYEPVYKENAWQSRDVKGPPCGGFNIILKTPEKCPNLCNIKIVLMSCHSRGISESIPTYFTWRWHWCLPHHGASHCCFILTFNSRLRILDIVICIKLSCFMWHVCTSIFIGVCVHHLTVEIQWEIPEEDAITSIIRLWILKMNLLGKLYWISCSRFILFQHSVTTHTLAQVWGHREQISSPKVTPKCGLKCTPKKCREMHMRKRSHDNPSNGLLCLPRRPS